MKLNSTSPPSKAPSSWSFVFALLVSTIAACGPPPNVAVVERQTIDSRVEAERIGGRRIRIVQPGDTLYAIAFENGLDAQQLAHWNSITDTSRLGVGQRIRLTKPLNHREHHVVTNRAVAGGRAVLVERHDQPQTVTNRSTSNASSALSSAKPAPNKTFAKPPKEALAKSNSVANTNWQWPTKGRVITKFATKLGQQGIDIQGKAGQPVVAAQNGEVVYVGNGLKGYGNMIIIKHDERFLSAYAHNQETFVREGQQIQANARIATLGRNRQQTEALHFQIRRDGQPVNPLSYLPNN